MPPDYLNECRVRRRGWRLESAPMLPQLTGRLRFCLERRWGHLRIVYMIYRCANAYTITDMAPADMLLVCCCARLQLSTSSRSGEWHTFVPCVARCFCFVRHACTTSSVHASAKTETHYVILLLLLIIIIILILIMMVIIIIIIILVILLIILIIRVRPFILHLGGQVPLGSSRL